MNEFVCSGCMKKKTPGQSNSCSKCGRVLCDICRAGKGYCKDIPQGTPGCAGYYRKP